MGTSCVKDSDVVSEQVKELLRFYREFYAIELNLTESMIPALDPSKPWHKRFGTILPMPSALSYEAACEPLRQFNRRFYFMSPEVFSSLLTDERNDEQDYVIRIDNSQEPSMLDLIDETQDSIRQKRIPTMTLRERIVFELFFWRGLGVRGTGRMRGDNAFPHLDVGSSTRCYGSVYSSGESPVAYWFKYDGRNEFCIDRPLQTVSWRIRPRRVITIWG